VRALIDNCNPDPQPKKQVERAVSRYQPESKAINSPSGEQPSASANRASTFHKSTSPVRPHAVAPTMKKGPMQYYIPKMLPEYVEVEPDVFQPYSDATVAGWRNEQRLATRQGKHQRAGVPQMVLLADKLQIAESVPLYPYLVRLGDLEKFRFLLDR
jgi:hypothetical protein